MLEAPPSPIEFLKRKVWASSEEQDCTPPRTVIFKLRHTHARVVQSCSLCYYLLPIQDKTLNKGDDLYKVAQLAGCKLQGVAVNRE